MTVEYINGSFNISSSNDSFYYFNDTTMPSLDLFYINGIDFQWNNISFNESYIAENLTSIQDEKSDAEEDWLWGDSQYPSGYSRIRIIFTAFLTTLLMIVITIGNALIIIAIATEKALKTLQNWFIASLAVADMLVGCLVMPFSLANEVMGYWYFGAILCETWLAVDVLLSTASILNLCMISLDRYWSITQAIKYLKQRTDKRVGLMIAMVWGLSTLISLPPLIGWKVSRPPSEYPICTVSDDMGYVLYSALGSFWIPMIVMVIVYFRIYLAARSRARRVVKKSEALTIQNEHVKDKINAKTTTFTSQSSTEKKYLKVASDEDHPVDSSSDADMDKGMSTEPDSSGSEEIKQRNNKDQGTNIKSIPNTDKESKNMQPLINKQNRATSLEKIEKCNTVSKKHRNKVNKLPSEVIKNPAAKECKVKDCNIKKDLPSNDIELTEKPKTKRRFFSLSRFKGDSSLSKKHREDTDDDDYCDNATVKAQRDTERQKRKLARAKERRATLILGLVMAAFILCWTPFFSFYVLAAFCDPCKEAQVVFAITFWLGYCNSALNPVIYTIFNRDFRKAFRKILFKR